VALRQEQEEGLFARVSTAMGVATNLALSYVESVEQLLAVQVAGALLGSAGARPSQP